MKHVFATILAILCILSLATVTSAHVIKPETGDHIVWEFNDAWTVNDFMQWAPSNCTETLMSNGLLRINMQESGLVGDRYYSTVDIAYRAEEIPEYVVDLDTYKFLAFKYKYVCAPEAGEDAFMTFYFSTKANNYDAGQFGLPGYNVSQPLVLSSRWENAILDMSALKDADGNATWKSLLGHLRIDFSANRCAGRNLYLEYIGFFKTAEEAAAYANEGSAPSITKDDATFTMSFNNDYMIDEVFPWAEDPTTVTRIRYNALQAPLTAGFTTLDITNIPSLDAVHRPDPDVYKYAVVTYNAQNIDDLKFGWNFQTLDDNGADIGAWGQNAYFANLTCDSQWNKVMIDLTTNENWKGNLGLFGLIAQTDDADLTDALLYISEIKFFTTADAAQTYITGVVEEPETPDNPAPPTDNPDNPNNPNTSDTVLISVCVLACSCMAAVAVEKSRKRK